MKYLKYGIFVPISLLIMSCITPATPPVIITKAPTVTTPRPDVYYNERIARDTDRSEILDRSKTRYRGASCEGDRDCEDICDDIYTRRTEKEDCEELSVSQVEELERIHEILEDPDIDDLEDINLADLDVYINIDIRPLSSAVARYNNREAEDMLTWIASDEAVADLFESEDDDYEILGDLLGELNADEGFKALEQNIDGSDNFLDVAVLSDNVVALEWIHEYLDDIKCDSVGGVDDASCLINYCSLGEAMDRSNAQDLLGFEYFEDYLDDIIEDGINGCTVDGASGCFWNNIPDNNGQLEDVDDLDDWWNELCA